jgi:small subunit ribosomal protein S8
MVTDPIGDMIVRLKNAAAAGLPSTLVPLSNFKWEIASKLKQAGYIKAISKKGKKAKKFIEVELAYQGKEPKLTEVKRVSKPSRRLYHNYKQIQSVRQGVGVAIYSTPQGVLTDKEARAAKVGGEILFKVF